MDLVIASNNKHKVTEIKSILKDYFENIYSLRELGIEIEVEETGETFAENALLKARAVSNAAGMPAIADDSGISANALDGRPGVYSARYSGEPCDDERNNDKLLEELKDKTDRSAYYTASICLYLDEENIITAEGKTYGTIISERRGDKGFGYDPIFLSDDLGKTLAEVDLEEKNKISHRARALKSLMEKLEKNARFGE
ncbi:MAG: XTP/dITP diphosphatase [Clostridia bacterium]|jgi:XTP/dITP diphosphohydrolase|nr:XTP/dITP diphosphatase [Clostridia bacterium]